MKVKKVSASVRYSSSIGQSRYKTVELSAEAAVDAKESWQEAQGELYDQLGHQLRELWTSRANGDSHVDSEAA